MLSDKRAFIEHLAHSHLQAAHVVPKSISCAFLDGLLQLLFPPLAEQEIKSPDEVAHHLHVLESDLEFILTKLEERLPEASVSIVNQFFDALPEVYEQLLEDARAIEAGDPAAVSTDEVIRTYPGFYAVAVYRVAHLLYELQVPLLPRIYSEHAHTKTGTDIHPGASIGNAFCIDHGTGVVIGETAIIGNNVKVYQGVTLGAASVDKSMANIKRHPTIEDNVVIYAGATILGGRTVVGKHSIIGGNVWLTESVPAYSRVYHRPQIKVSQAPDPAYLINFSI
ncbi:serine O-acetyltransferase EpsC [Pontibacter cellulosilyticus]|uniref:Serine acetyltransferase n=1 Tax=Pontibacter cellulosilyticus TaxID=1720253 RepID=A0A923SNX9_9BACT|nr:serine O-acetyltransferase EpsC [Pontibacter cellulosilyticus]MBC5993625.1 serine acetyltransferase [Pontibacter cellulosilyticus]